MDRLQPSIMAKALILLYAAEFGGKANQKFRMGRLNYRTMSQSGRLTTSYLEEVEEELGSRGYDQFDCGDYLAVQRASVFEKARRPPRSLREAAVEAALKKLKAIPSQGAQESDGEEENPDGDDDVN